jgi:ribosomal protein S18 acetylase RimI-like enzyme
VDTQVAIRPLAEGEIEVLERHMRRTHDIHRKRYGKQQRGEALYLIAWLREQPVGHLLINWAGNSSAQAAAIGPCPTLEDIAVSPVYQSRGIGSRLMEAAEELVRERGYARMGLDVGLENHGARRLYERRGYEDIGLGEQELRWSYIDAAGQEQWEGEVCNFLVKDLEAQL